MDDPDATHSKPVENSFGNLDRLICKSGPQRFDFKVNAYNDLNKNQMILSMI